jgi:hypothetical protein
MKISDNKVAKVETEVDAAANLGIFNKELFSIIKLILVATAKTIAKMNFQLISRRIMLSKFSRFPEISDLSPRSTIDSVLVMQKASSQNIPNIIRF